ncbi:MAG: hypothetical protein UV74_C0013G0413 [Candidatus Woesebacteria bacterium GW2011_GWB1_43_14]|uniref:Carboxypeptidase regulatory-like domain-containing protein n=1 Tax=Candidatus Woesebacteria bacterium GW2011_GWB1_43_14 TaxID=1618578 RepID=A0A0G1FQI1_9BACT|nr:MAG: hypothetical protein UT21_C0001G0125 [Candidatus Woesebacteria bacterium GW2011_GWA1_39_11b]KKS78289.1 MAG: hypothetical protein UV51_C0001G0005 [Candidatus Woesebacteria bacterium GW2011_GWC1_42_9]KKS97291.1 MAG: hypothetical protein UV74_C0013G0413 [Candidatus Woesebacteria bacterium GW2011_GWB1_43_14]
MPSSRGQIYIGTIIALGIFFILSQAVVTLVLSAYDLVSYSRARITARHLASERMESVRNLSYLDVGTQGGIPSGSLPQEEDVNKNGLNYHVQTSIIYIDDPFDGSSPIDLSPEDYKRVRIDVSWGGIAASKGNSITLITDASPKGPGYSSGGGVLAITVVNANAYPVAQAKVTIVAQTTPEINLTSYTNDSGQVILPGTPTCNNCYQITVTKEDFSTERTYSNLEVANPTKPHVSVYEGFVSEISFVIDELGTLNISTLNSRDNNFAPLGDQTIRLLGSKIIGTDETDLPVPKYDQELTTNGSGNLEINDFEWDNYQVLLPESLSRTISGTNPLSPFSMLPNSSLNLLISLAPNSPSTYLASFTDSSLNPQATVSATLSSTNPVFDESITAGNPEDPDFGQIFFNNLSDGTYNLSATSSGFVDHSSTVNIPNQSSDQIILIPQ